MTPQVARHLRAERTLVAKRESLALARAALERYRGTITEPDWTAHVVRAEQRVRAAQRELVMLAAA